MVVTVHLHTILQIQSPTGRVSSLVVPLPDGATMADVLRELNITLDPEALILAVNHKVVAMSSVLVEGDRVDIIPAISGG